MLLPIKLAVDAICGVLNSLGGWHFLWMRRFCMPVLLAVTACFCLHPWYYGALCLPAIGTLCLKYFSGENWGRGLWLFVQAIALAVGLTLTGHLAWFIFVPYCIGSGILGGIYKNWFQPIGDLIAGVYLGLFILFVH